MGATWLGRKHRNLIALLSKLELGIFEQRLGEKAIYEAISTSPPQLVSLPPNSDPTFRIQGGTGALINTLAAALEPEQIYTGLQVQSIEAEGDGIKVNCKDQAFKRGDRSVYFTSLFAGFND